MTTPATEGARRHRIFAVVWGGQAVSLLGSSIASFAVAFSIHEQTRNSAVLAFALTMAFIGSIYVAPFLGVLVDRWGAAPTALLGCLGAAACCVGLAGVAHLGLAAHVPELLVLLAVKGVFDAACSLALVASVRALRSEADLSRTSGVMSLVESSPALVGPVLGGVLSSVMPLTWILLLDAATFVICAAGVVASGWRHDPHLQPARTGARPRLFPGAAEGVRYIWRDPALRSLQLAMACSNACNGFGMAAVTAFILSASAPHPPGPEAALAITRVVMAVGLTAGAALMTWRGARVDRYLAVVGALLLGAVLGRIGLALTDALLAWCMALFVRNASMSICNAPLTAAWQEHVPVDKQGVVFGGRRLLGQGLYPVAALLGGFVGLWLTPALGEVDAQRWVLISAGLVEAVAVAALLLRPSVKDFLNQRATPEVKV